MAAAPVAMRDITPEEAMEEFAALGQRPFMSQAKYFLNAYHKEFRTEDAVKQILEFVKRMTSLNEDKGSAGCDLDEFQAHRFLEIGGEVLTVLAMRAKLKEIDLDSNNRMSLIEYLVFKYEKPILELMRLPQESNAELEAVLDIFQQRTDKMSELEKKIASGGVVARGRASAELAQMNAEDLTPLYMRLCRAQAGSKKTGGGAKALEAAAQEEADSYKPGRGRKVDKSKFGG